MILNELLAKQNRKKWKLRQERWDIEHGYQKLEPETYLVDEGAIPRRYLYPFIREDAVETRKFNLVYEGLITSQPAADVIRKLEEHFPYLRFSLNFEKKNNTYVIMVSLDTISVKDFNFLIQLVDVLGWQFSGFSINQTKWQKFNLSKLMNIINHQFDNITLQVETKFDIEEHKVPDILYHTTPTSHLQKIQKIGIVPKSKNPMISHNDRIYVATNLDNLEHRLLPHMAEESNQKDWTILSINTSPQIHPNIRWFKDPNYPYGYYTLTNIPPTRLQIVKQIQLK